MVLILAYLVELYVCIYMYSCYACACTLCVVCVQVLTDAESYDEAVQMLSKRYIAAPAYFIVAGSKPNEGAVITRDRNVLSDLWQLNVSSSDPNSWYILETNYVCTLLQTGYITSKVASYMNSIHNITTKLSHLFL